ncbi:MAG TPA: hypothetical protein VN634_14170 [Candidatus Limnocylindrales bacterium]|nr:hypothetical protein [Candidatus Limnocylindrales bacterium]
MTTAKAVSRIAPLQIDRFDTRELDRFMANPCGRRRYAPTSRNRCLLVFPSCLAHATRRRLVALETARDSLGVLDAELCKDVAIFDAMRRAVRCFTAGAESLSAARFSVDLQRSLHAARILKNLGHFQAGSCALRHADDAIGRRSACCTTAARVANTSRNLQLRFASQDVPTIARQRTAMNTGSVLPN